jgi:hypothetical protein
MVVQLKQSRCQAPPALSVVEIGTRQHLQSPQSPKSLRARARTAIPYPNGVCYHTSVRTSTSLPQIHTPTLREFWQRQWQHECDYITQTHGVDRETVIADDREGQTVGAFLDVAEHLKTLIWHSYLPNQHELYEPCLAMTDYTFRNIKIDPETLRVTSFLDWDDVFPFCFPVVFQKTFASLVSAVCHSQSGY